MKISVVLSLFLGCSLLCGGEPKTPAESSLQNKRGVWQKNSPSEQESYRKWRDSLSGDQKEWELQLEKNLGGFYFPQHVKSKVAELNGKKYTDWGFRFVEDVPGLPRILIIGDSISRGYTVPVQKLLKGIANVHRAPANCGNSENVRRNLDEYLGSGKWDVIVYNFGLHDAGGNTLENRYRENWTAITKRLKATGAALIWVRTTPKWNPEKQEADSSVLRINEWADSMVKEYPEIHVCDLYSVLAGSAGGIRESVRADHVHMTAKGNQLISKEVATSISIRARFGQTKVPYLKTFSLPKPPEFRICDPAEFKIDLNRIGKLQYRPVFGSRKQLLETAEFLKNDPAGRLLWKSMVDRVLVNLNVWNILPLTAPRYSARFSGIGRMMPFVYTITGHPLLGKFIHDYTMHALTLGDGFWYGSNSQHAGHAKERVGTLDNSFLGKTFTMILTFAPDVFSEAERREAERQLREDGMNGCLRFLKTNSSVHNFLAVMASGVFIPATYFQEQESRNFSFEKIKQFLTRSIEADGSYGEGFGYFGYPLGELFYSFLAMSSQERQTVLSDSGLKHSQEWLCYPAYYGKDAKGQKRFHRTSFGDDNYFSKINPRNLYLLSFVFPSPLTQWLGEYYGDRKDWSRRSWQELMLGSPGSLSSKGPEEMGLPLLRAFLNGESYIRNSWGGNSTVFCLFSVHNVGSRGFHQRRESHNFNLGAFGIPIVMSSGNTNVYGSSIQREYLILSRAANTITIDDTEQKTAQKQEARILLCKAGKNADVIVGDALTAYTQPLKKALRCVIYLRKLNCFVIADILESTGKKHFYTSRLHLNNLDFKSSLESGHDGFLFKHPEVSMKISFFSSSELDIGKEKGLIVSEKYPVRDVLTQAKQIGNTLVPAVRNRKEATKMTLFTVLHPFRGELANYSCTLQDNSLKIGKFTISLSDNGIDLYSGDEKESFSW